MIPPPSWVERLTVALQEPAKYVARGFEEENLVASVETQIRRRALNVTVFYRPGPRYALCAYVELIELAGRSEVKRSLRSADPEGYASDVLLEIDSTVVDSSLRGFVVWNESLRCHVRYWGEVDPDDVWSRPELNVVFNSLALIERVSIRLVALLPPDVGIVSLELGRHPDGVTCQLRTTGTSGFPAVNVTSVPLYLSVAHRDMDALVDGVVSTLSFDILDGWV